MIFATFSNLAWDQSTGSWGTNYIEACGDRSVIILDGRSTRDTHSDISRTECTKRGFKGYTLYKGETFTRASVIQPPRLI